MEVAVVFPSSSRVAAAQEWLNQGFGWALGFNYEDAVQCFDKALEADPQCAIAAWGGAYAAGPNYNDPAMTNASIQSCVQRCAKAKTLLQYTSAKEAALVEAIQERYALMDASESRRHLDMRYVEAMRKTYNAFPDDGHIAYLFAESMVVVYPWKLWSDACPAKLRQECLVVLQDALERFPNHMGLCHLYIHAMEMGPESHKAAAAADCLRTCALDLGHLHHMPSHIDMLLGKYKNTIEANIKAVKADEKYMDKYGTKHDYSLYIVHDYHMLVYGCMFQGRYSEAIHYARKVSHVLHPANIAAFPDYYESFLPIPYHVLVRFGKWDLILQEPFPQDRVLYSSTAAFLHYARGIAFAALEQTPYALSELKLFRAARHTVSKEKLLHNVFVQDLLAIAEVMLDGEIQYRLGNIEEAFRLLRTGVDLDDALPFDEPWGWMQPVRHALGALLSEQGQVKEAAGVYRADLARHPNNVWSLHGLLSCSSDPDGSIKKAYDNQVKYADAAPKASCFCKLTAFCYSDSIAASAAQKDARPS